MTLDGLAYSGTRHDRAASLRTDPDWVDTRLRQDDTQVVPMWRDRTLLTAAGQPAVLSAGQGRDALAAGGERVLLGLDGATANPAPARSTASAGDSCVPGPAWSIADAPGIRGGFVGD